VHKKASVVYDGRQVCVCMRVQCTGVCMRVGR